MVSLMQLSAEFLTMTFVQIRKKSNVLILYFHTSITPKELAQ